MESPPNASLVAGGVASLPLADTSTDVIITAEPLLDLLSDTTGPFLAELNRVLTPSGIWLVVATASAAEEYRTRGFGPLAMLDQPIPLSRRRWHLISRSPMWRPAMPLKGSLASARLRRRLPPLGR